MLSRNVGTQQPTLFNAPEEQRTQLQCGGSPKSRRSEDLRDNAKRVCTDMLLIMRKFVKVGPWQDLLFLWT